MSSASRSRAAIVAGVAISLASCVTPVQLPAPSDVPVASGTGERDLGKYGLFIESAALDTSFPVSGIGCFVTSYPLDARAAFAAAVMQGVEDAVGRVEPIDFPAEGDEVRELGLAAVIAVRAQPVSGDVVASPDVWSARIDARVMVAATLAVDTPDGRVRLTDIRHDGNGKAGGGVACAGGAEAVAEATTGALRGMREELSAQLAGLDTAPAADVAEEVVPAYRPFEPIEVTRATKLASSRQTVTPSVGATLPAAAP